MEQLELLRLAYLAEVLDEAPEVWCDILVEVLALGDVLILARELQRKPRGSRDLDRPVCPLLGAHAPEEEEVTRIVVSD